MVRRPFKVRRSPHLVAYWRGSSLLICNYATRVTTEGTPVVCELLHRCDKWITIDAIRERTNAGGSLLPAIIDRLVDLTLLSRSDRPSDPRSTAMSSLDRWNPEAGFFHFATRDVRFSSARERRRHALTAIRVSMPRPVKRYQAAKTVDLPRPEASAFTDVLVARRTSRRYSSVPVTLKELSSLLAFTVGVQHWVRTEDGEVPLKTSPSGGARHPIECYVVARAVAGLPPAIYHYAADRHVLERIGPKVPIDRMKAYVPESGYFANASAMVFFTAVFARQIWRYPYSRAYRAALIEAGHVCQTFLLTATSLGLAPYCVMGLADTLIEGDLGIDGITESVLYCAGVGRPPRGTAWAPLPRGTLQVRPNKRLFTR
jgi:SagB-type dehydrogenase family enzyme